ncbi:MAG: hypothetical protein RBT20_12215, partial [Syntrophales bacterium]|nr:hypothetical protein [Syntrophales bacterium]
MWQIAERYHEFPIHRGGSDLSIPERPEGCQGKPRFSLPKRFFLTRSEQICFRPQTKKEKVFPMGNKKPRRMFNEFGFWFYYYAGV